MPDPKPPHNVPLFEQTARVDVFVGGEESDPPLYTADFTLDQDTDGCVTLRDLFAAFALAGILARPDYDGNDPAAVAFGYADKMLRIREAHS